jgi:type II secretory ATPase GspE/PulE/Tfp pilus assembly ATPase PilB-like protein
MEGHESRRGTHALSRMVARAERPLAEAVVTIEQLRETLGRHRRASTRKLGAKLLELGFITNEQLSAALAIQRNDSARHLGHILVDLGYLTNGELHQVLCLQLGIPLIGLPQFRIDRAVLRLLPDELVQQCRAVPLCRMDGRLVVAVPDPFDGRSLERVRFFAQMPLIPVMAPRQEIDQAIRNHYSPIADVPYGQPSASTPWRERVQATFGHHVPPQNELDAAILELVATMISDAHASGASDVHLDAAADGQQLAVRFRRHGRLTEYLHVPRHLQAGVVRHIKALAGVHIAAGGPAQEGRIEVHVRGVDLQLRVMVVPTRDGTEHIAMKLLRVTAPPAPDQLGIGEREIETLKQLLVPHGGLIVVAGPAQSGITTTAHALLSLSTSGAKIWTAEHQVDIQRAGVSQVHVDAAIGWDYPAALRAIVRADPDIILVGDTPDRDTAALAIEAALRGCRVISTVRSGSAIAAVARMLELGVNAFSFSDALQGVLAQRLARRLCAACRVSRPLTPAEMRALSEEYCDGTSLDASDVCARWSERHGESRLHLYSAPGCEACGGSGYDGHVGLFELLPATPRVRQLIRQRRSIDEVAAAVVHDGMRTLKQDGIEKALAGASDLLEIRAATV